MVEYGQRDVVRDDVGSLQILGVALVGAILTIGAYWLLGS